MRRLFVFLGLLCALSAAPVVTAKAPSPATYFMRPAAACIPAERPRPPSSRPTAVDRVARGPVRLGGEVFGREHVG